MLFEVKNSTSLSRDVQLNKTSDSLIGGDITCFYFVNQ